MFRILLVEDDPEISGVLERQLTAWNYQVGLIRDFGMFWEISAPFNPIWFCWTSAFLTATATTGARKSGKSPRFPFSSSPPASDNLNIIMAVNLGGDDFPGQALRPECAPGQVQALLRRAYDFGAPEPALEYREPFWIRRQPPFCTGAGGCP